MSAQARVHSKRLVDQFASNKTDYSRDAFASEVCCIPFSPSLERARGTPGARCTHGLVRSVGVVSAQGLATVSPGIPGVPHAVVLTAYNVLSPAATVVAARPAECFPLRLKRTLHRRTDAREASGPHAFTVRASVVRQRFLRSLTVPLYEETALNPNSAPDAAASTASRPADRDDREPPLSVRRDDWDYMHSRNCVKWKWEINLGWAVFPHAPPSSSPERDCVQAGGAPLGASRGMASWFETAPSGASSP